MHSRQRLSLAARRYAGHVFRDVAAVAMRIYLALGDSISIDDYTGVPGGGAPSQLAGKLGLGLVDLTRDGNTTQGVLADLSRALAAADVVTLTAGGNDLLSGDLPRRILRRLHQIAKRIKPLGARRCPPNTTDYQARRPGTRFRRGEKGLGTPHTLNGTAATGRWALAILENFQGEVPEALRACGAPATVTTR
jgi:GDSL-like Lipase/Acylhydrolase family